MLKKLLIMCCVLTACRTQPAETVQPTGGHTKMMVDQLNEAVYDVLSGDQFKEIDGEKFYGKGASRGGSRSHVSKLSRDEVLALLSNAMEPSIESQAWGDDYGQYHVSFQLNDAENMRFGIGISSLKSKQETFKSATELLRNYDSDIVYTPPFEWNE
ncbi:hypothetical protein [Deinococcus arcticus]|nr:hypothetical protein [Deinococcus arcticus]